MTWMTRCNLSWLVYSEIVGSSWKCLKWLVRHYNPSSYLLLLHNLCLCLRSHSSWSLKLTTEMSLRKSLVIKRNLAVQLFWGYTATFLKPKPLLSLLLKSKITILTTGSRKPYSLSSQRVSENHRNEMWNKPCSRPEEEPIIAFRISSIH